MKKVIYSMLALLCAAFAFTSCEDVPMPYDQPGEGGEDPIVIQPTGAGTVDNPYNVTAALEYIESLGADVESEQNIYIKGGVVTVTEEYTTNYGNGTYYISDDGTNKNQFYVYRAMYLGNRKFTSGDTQIQEGDTVVVCGKVVNYKGTTTETAQNKSYLYSLNGIMGGGVGPGPGGDTGQPKGDGTLQNPYNTAGVVNYIKTLGSDVESPGQVYVKGTIVSIKEEYGLQFGNATFDIGDPGTGVTFTAYQLNYFDNKKYTGGTNIKVGDEVILFGHVVNFRGNTPETVRGKAYLYSLNGQTSGEQTEGQPKGSGTLADPFNPVAANNYASSLAADAKSDKDVYIKGKISRIANNGEFGTQYGNATFYISEDGGQSNEFYVFRTLYLGNEKYTGGENIKVGDEVVICGKVTNYKGNTPETAANESFLYSLNGVTKGGGSGGGGDDQQGNVKITTDGNIVTFTVEGTNPSFSSAVDLNEQGWANQDKVTSLTLPDGTVITFGQGEGSNAPAFYTATKGVRVYAKNTITISGAAVSKVVLTCDSYNGTNYTGNSTMYATASGTTFVICNEHSEAKGGEQLRVQAIEITYAQ